MKKNFLLLALLILTCSTIAQERNLKLVKAPTENPSSEKRKAMVIGMSDYGSGRSLSNTLNDADDMADVLTRLGFEVTLLKDNDKRSLEANLTAWYKTIEGNDMAVFYYAGHGIEVDGQNYLVPVDAEMNSQTDVQYNTLNVYQVLGNMEEKAVTMKLLILDACRDNPFKRSWTRSTAQGLAGMTAPAGTFIAFAASPGFTAQDGGSYDLRNGVFTHYLKKEILTAGITIDEVFNNVTGAVADLTREHQIPFRNSSLRRNFFFIPSGNEAPSPAENKVDKPALQPLTDITELLRQADACYDKKQYNEAFLLYRQAAEQGNAKAQSKIGYCCLYGYGINQDYEQAIEWFRKAAVQGDAGGQNRLGVCYFMGYGVTEDSKQGVEWFKKAAEQGYIKAIRNLGVCYYEGEGVTMDYKQAVVWLKKAAELGDEDAQYLLGDCYFNGEGVTKDYKQAVEWYRKAAEQGHATAQNNLASCYFNGDGLTKDYKQGIYWYKKAADQGDVYAQYNLGECYYNGSVVQRDYQQAFELFRKAAEQDYPKAQYYLGNCYYLGNGVTKDQIQAVEWYRKAAEQNYDRAQYQLGMCYEGGYGVPKDFTKAIEWLRKAAEQGYDVAQVELGSNYYYGLGVEKDTDLAAYWFKKAASQGNTSAISRLKDMKIKYP